MNFLQIDNKFRIFVSKIVFHKYFEKFIFTTIIISCILLLFKNPYTDPQTLTNKIFLLTDYLVLTFFFLEICMKIITHGFIFNGENSFIMNLWNTFDFLLFIITFIGVLDDQLNFTSYNIKSLRAIRMLRIIKYFKGLQLSMQTLFLSFPEIMKLLLFYLIFLFFLDLLELNI